MPMSCPRRRVTAPIVYPNALRPKQRRDRLGVAAVRKFAPVGVGGRTCGRLVAGANIRLDQAGTHVLTETLRRAQRERLVQRRDRPRGARERIQLQAAERERGQRRLCIRREIGDDAIQRRDRVGRDGPTAARRRRARTDPRRPGAAPRAEAPARPAPRTLRDAARAAPAPATRSGDARRATRPRARGPARASRRPRRNRSPRRVGRPQAGGRRGAAAVASVTSSASPAASRRTRSGTRSPRTSTWPRATATRNRPGLRSTSKCVPTTSTVASPHSICQRRGPPGRTSNVALPRATMAMKVEPDDSSGSSRAPPPSTMYEPSESDIRAPVAGASTAAIAAPEASRSGPASWRRISDDRGQRRHRHHRRGHQLDAAAPARARDNARRSPARCATASLRRPARADPA